MDLKSGHFACRERSGLQEDVDELDEHVYRFEVGPGPAVVCSRGIRIFQGTGREGAPRYMNEKADLSSSSSLMYSPVSSFLPT